MGLEAKSLWINVKDQKPACDQCCYVCNDRFGTSIFEAIYSKDDDYFWQVDANRVQSVPIDVTHWFAKPDVPVNW
jgi:hypothetical protein